MNGASKRNEKHMRKQTSAGIVVFFESGAQREYLLLQYAAGHWDFAKGKLEHGETDEQAAIRELHEETGLQEITLLPGFKESLVYVFNDFKGKPIEKTVSFFVGYVPEKKDIVISREHQGYAWLPYQEAVTILTYANAREVLIKAEEFLKARK